MSMASKTLPGQGLDLGAEQMRSGKPNGHRREIEKDINARSRGRIRN
jgi:hypothetical protein